MIALALFALFAASWPATATVFSVNSTSDIGDSTPGDGFCSAPGGGCTLRAAIQEHNALGGTNTIMLPTGLYKLTFLGYGEDAALAGDLDIKGGTLTILGAGATSSIVDADYNDRVFEIFSGTIAMSNLTIRNGSVKSADVGGAILIHAGSLALSNAVVSGSISGSVTAGIHVVTGASVDLTNVVISDNLALSAGFGSGGGLGNYGRATLENVTFSANVAPLGAGLVSGDMATTIISDSTFSNNSASLCCGGGIYNSGTLAAANTTISSNHANHEGGGLDNSTGGTATLTNVTFWGNDSGTTGGAIRNASGASLSIRNSIVANSTAGGNCSGTVTSFGYNISSDATCLLANSGDRNSLDPFVGALANNGGPTQTHALLGGSPAIDAGDPAGCTDYLARSLPTDQRGIVRPQRARCDSGAFELNMTPKNDFSGDAKSDVLLRNDSNGDLGMWLMNGTAIASGAGVGSPGVTDTEPGLGDFNGDRKTDILLQDSAGNLGMWIMNGSTITSGAFVASLGGSSIAAVADFNGDGKADILLRDSLGNLGMWFMNGPAITGGAFVGSPGGSYSVVGAADFNGDGKADILLRDSLGNLGMWIMNGSVITSGAFVGSPGSYTVVGLADFNGDGKADILLRDSLGTLGMWIMNGPVITSGALVGAPGGFSVTGVGDYNGDGKADILLRNDLTGDVGVWIMNGPTITSGAFVSALPTSVSIVR